MTFKHLLLIGICFILTPTIYCQDKKPDQKKVKYVDLKTIDKKALKKELEEMKRKKKQNASTSSLKKENARGVKTEKSGNK